MRVRRRIRGNEDKVRKERANRKGELGGWGFVYRSVGEGGGCIA